MHCDMHLSAPTQHKYATPTSPRVCAHITTGVVDAKFVAVFCFSDISPCILNEDLPRKRGMCVTLATAAVGGFFAVAERMKRWPHLWTKAASDVPTMEVCISFREVLAWFSLEHFKFPDPQPLQEIAHQVAIRMSDGACRDLKMCVIPRIANFILYSDSYLSK